MGFCCGISLDLSGVSEGCEVATQKLHDRIGKNMKEQQLMEKKNVFWAKRKQKQQFQLRAIILHIQR